MYVVRARDATVPRSVLPFPAARRLATVTVTAALALASCLPVPGASSAPAARPSATAIRSLQVTDVRDSAFFVSWVSDQPEVGAVRWGAAGTVPGTRVADIRGDVSSTVHLVKVTGLSASTPYAFDVTSGATVDNQSGQHHRATTGPTLPISASDSIYGRVLDGGNRPARDLLVTVLVRGADGTAAAPMASLVGPNDDGYWTSNLGNARAANGLSWFTALANARVEVAADGGGLGRAAATIDLVAARSGTSVVKLDGAAPAAAAIMPAATPSAAATSVTAPTPTAVTPGGAPPVTAPGPTGGGATTGGAMGRPIVVAPLPGTVPLPPLPDGSTLAWPPALDAASARPGPVPAPPLASTGGAPATGAKPGDDAAADPPGSSATGAPGAAVEVRGSATVDATGAAVVHVAGVGEVAVGVSFPARAGFVASGIASMAVAFDAAPPVENEVQAGSLGGGVVVPAGRPIDLRLDLRDATGNPVRPTEDGTTVDVTLPVLPTGPGAVGTFAWLVATYDADGFAGYERPPAAFDPETNRTTLSLSPASMQGTLFLPASIVPATVATIAEGARMWSNPWSDATDFGPAGPELSELVVVAPQVRGRIYVYNPNALNYGWIDVAWVIAQ